MRSNDVWLGFPYDVFVNTCLQQILANEMQLELGTYTHHVGSLHLYEKNEKAAREALYSPLTPAWESPAYDDNLSSVQDAIIAERMWRDGIKNFVPRVGPMMNEFLGAIAPHWQIDYPINHEGFKRCL
jgi:hypothetical protein